MARHEPSPGYWSALKAAWDQLPASGSTAQKLAALNARIEGDPPVPWWQANGYSSPFNGWCLYNAGVLTDAEANAVEMERGGIIMPAQSDLLDLDAFFANPSVSFHPLREPLGAIVMAFAQLEAKLTMAINNLIGIDYQAGVALEDLMQSAAARIKLFHTLAALKTKGILLKRLKGKTGLRERLDKSNSYRNDYIHGEWTGINHDNTYIKIRYKANTGLHIVRSTMSVSIPDLWAAHNFIFVTAVQLEEWRFSYNYRERPELWPASWREKP
jgi:hypothetical protein